MRKTILIIDDEADIRNLVKEILEDEGYATLTAANSKEAYAVLEEHKPDMAVLDIWLQDSRHDGLQILETIKAGDHKDMPVVMISGHGTVETAVNAIKNGAYDFIEKPFKSDRLLLMVKRGLETASLKQENTVLKKRSRSSVDIIGRSYHAKNLRERVKMLASNKSRVLIAGPLGAGKTTLASLIHSNSAISSAPFVVYECSASPELQMDMVEAFENAQGGTIAIQDIDMLNKEQQKVLLGLLQNDRYSARVIASTRNADAIEESLRQRVEVEVIDVPPLRERKQDISDILDVYIRQVSKELGLTTPEISKDVVKLCESYHWQGNLYELQAAMIWALVHHGDSDKAIQPSSLPVKISGLVAEDEKVEILPLSPPHINEKLLELPLRDAREMFERDYLTSQVERFDGNISKTAQFVGMERSALHRKIKSLQVKGEDDASHSKAVSG